MNILQTINDGFDKVLAAIKGLKPDEALTKQIATQSAEIQTLKSENAQLKEDASTKDARIDELQKENDSLKEGKETAEANATKLETELKEAKATIENPEGEIQKKIAAGTQKAVSEAGHPPIEQAPPTGAKNNDGKELKGLARVKAAWKTQER